MILPILLSYVVTFSGSIHEPDAVLINVTERDLERELSIIRIG